MTTTEEQSELLHLIKSKISLDEKIRGELEFNFYYHKIVYDRYYGSNFSTNDVAAMIRGFIAKEDNLSTKSAIIHNSYSIATMLPLDLLVDILAGRSSNMLVLDSDSAKFGAICALNYKVYGISKLEMLKKILLFSQFVL